jgi:hypothetical protein
MRHAASCFVLVILPLGGTKGPLGRKTKSERGAPTGGERRAAYFSQNLTNVRACLYFKRLAFIFYLVSGRSVSRQVKKIDSFSPEKVDGQKTF